MEVTFQRNFSFNFPPQFFQSGSQIQRYGQGQGQGSNQYDDEEIWEREVTEIRVREGNKEISYRNVRESGSRGGNQGGSQGGSQIEAKQDDCILL
jgi:hypothetical protein